MDSKQKKIALDDHYTHVTKEYQNFWFSQKKSKTLQNYLNCNFEPIRNLNENALLIEYGGGEGTFAQLIYETFKLKNDVLCADPSQQMINKANSRNGVIGVFFNPDKISINDNPFPKKYHKVDAIFVKECIHHIPKEDLVRVFNFLNSILKQTGVIVIQTRPNYTKNYPFPSIMHTRWFSVDPFEVFHIVSSNCNLQGKTKVLLQDIELTKDHWFQFLIKRAWSTFEQFTDKELDDGVLELKQKFKIQNTIKFQDIAFFIYFEKIRNQ